MDFDVNEYSVADDSVGQGGAAVATGTFTASSGAAGEYAFDIATTSGNGTARFRVANDAVVGNYRFPGTTVPMNFIAARRFATSAADFSTKVDLQIFSREEGSGGGVITSLYTARYEGPVLTLCIHTGITVVDACPVAPIVYDLTFNPDGRIDYVARPPTVETGSVHVARIGSSWVHLRAAANAAGQKRFRIGIPLQATLGAAAGIGDTRGNYGLITVTMTDVTFAGAGSTGTSNFGIGSFPNITFAPGWPPGLFIYSETGADQYFIGQSPELVVVNGARNFSNPFVNGYLAIGLRP